MNKKLLVIPIFLVLAIIALNIAKDRSLSSEHEIYVSGNIEITEVDVSFKIPGRMMKRLVQEGQIVEEGQEIAILDRDELVQEVALHEAEVQASEEVFLELLNGYRPEEIGQAEARLKQTEADLRRQDSEYARQKQLFEEEVISSREFDATSSGYEVAKAKQQEAAEHLSLLKSGYRQEKINQANAKFRRAKEVLKLAEIKLSQALITAPIVGYVVSENVESGEFVAAGTPIVTIGNLKKVWLRAYINEYKLGLVNLGQKVHVKTDSFSDKTYEGRISFISPQAEFTPKNVQTEEERVKLVYRIKIDIDNSDLELKPGMPADGFIQLQG